MAYIETQKVKEIRQLIKKEYPAKEGWKISVTRQNHSSVNVAVLEAPINMLEGSETDRDYIQVNTYYIEEHYPEHIAKVLQRLSDIAHTEDYFDHSDAMTDYFHCSHYVHVNIGEWDKPFKVSKQ